MDTFDSTNCTSKDDGGESYDNSSSSQYTATTEEEEGEDLSSNLDGGEISISSYSTSATTTDNHKLYIKVDGRPPTPYGAQRTLVILKEQQQDTNETKEEVVATIMSSKMKDMLGNSSQRSSRWKEKRRSK